MDRLSRFAKAFAHACAALIVVSAVAYATSFNNGASGSAVRAMLNRVLLMQYNVQDYGAVGNSSTDDTAAIQAAVDAAISAGGGTVYFPALAGNTNCYKTIEPIVFTGGSGTGTRLVFLAGEKGIDLNGSRVCGNFSGYVFDAPDTGGSNNFYGLTGLLITNPHAAGGGVRAGGIVTGEISECKIQAGLNAVMLASSSYQMTLKHCVIIGTNNVGTGVFTTQSIVENNSIVGWDVGLQGWNLGLNVTGNRFEVNNTAMVLGRDSAGSTNGLSGAIIAGNSTEQVNIAADIIAASGVTFTGNAFTGVVGPDGMTPPLYGIRIANCTGCFFGGNTISALASVAGTAISDVSGGNISFSGHTSGSWAMPSAGTARGTFSFSASNNPAYVLPFSALPSPIEGMQRDISDGTNGLGWGDVATNTGTHTTHYSIRYNGSNWTVTGK